MSRVKDKWVASKRNLKNGSQSEKKVDLKMSISVCSFELMRGS